MRKFFTILVLFGVFHLYSQPTGSRYELVKLQEVNTYYNEGAPIISPDGKTLYFFVDSHPDNTEGKNGSQDIWMSTKNENGEWSAPKHLTSPFNQSKLNQVFNVLPDGTIFIRGTRSKNEVGFSLVTPSGSWREIEVKDFTKMNKGQFWGASISNDLKHLFLYFSETNNDLRSDIYITHAGADGKFSTPVKMSISTNLDDFGPYISPDQSTLYFATNYPRPSRHGLIDIYKCKRLDDTWNKWGPPVNVGDPLNTSAEDDYFSMDTQGNVFVARSNSKQDGGNLDIFVLAPKVFHITLNGTVYDDKSKHPISNSSVSITVPGTEPINLKSDATGKISAHLAETEKYSINATASGFLPYKESFTIPLLQQDTILDHEIFLTSVEKVLTINGKVSNQKTGAPIDARINIINRQDESVNLNPRTNNGSYSQRVPKTGLYVFTASKEGFLNTVDSLYYDNDEISPMTKNLVMQPIEVGVTVRLKNIYFDYNKATLKMESFVELDKVVKFLNENPTVEIEIEGHTDSDGTDLANLKLSQGRSESVMNYIVSKGISVDRLKAKGFGESKPIDTNSTPEGRANNRRVEFTVLKT